MAKITKEQFDALPDALKESFEADGEEYVLKTEDNSGLKSALEAERKRATQFEKIAKKVEGVDIDELLKLKSEKAKADEDEAKKAGRFEEILQAKESEWNAKYIAEKERADRLEQDFTEKEVESLMVSMLSSTKVIPERLDRAKRLMRDNIEIEKRDGKSVYKFKDSTGYAQEMKPEDFAAKWKADNDFFFQPDGKTGSDDRNDTNGNTFEENKQFEGLTGTEKLKAARKAQA